MKGIVFNVLEELVQRDHGEDAWEDMLDEANVDGIYTSLGNYSDKDLHQLVGAASEMLNLPASAIIHWFGKEALPIFAERYPRLFSPHKSARDFVLHLNDIIHPEVRKLYPGADVPEFEFETPTKNKVIMHYQSHRKLCDFAKGLIEGAAQYYQEIVTTEETQCMHDGAPKCILHLHFSTLNTN